MCGRYLVQHWKEACAAKGTDFLYDDDDHHHHHHHQHCDENNDGDHHDHRHDDHCEENNDDVI